ncbi:hypothetical protein FE782_27970 [Paenibacillus antri]|uniref:Uncharacterized protein n=1 Tax=Paenibacillus antri TaxID=2582848 RepID=A0A5R9G1T9_9BACL|nr:hypothetical protein [Paenibacillus antri]TLS48979.1 hypothetical protein FE782_27970 [Paenibacillus antri]
MEGTIRLLQQLSDVPIERWTEAELRRAHDMLSDASPWLNSQGVSLHHQVIDELKGRERSPTLET